MINSNLKPLKINTHMVLPTVFDDSLSYYEYLCKVVDKLNGVINEINNIHCNVENLPNDYITPQMFGAIGDGITDDTLAFQKALNTGLSLYVPLLNGSRYRITDTLYLTSQRQSIIGDIEAHDWAYFTSDTEYKRGCIGFETDIVDKPLFHAKSSMNCFTNLSCRAVNNNTGYAIRYEKDSDKTNADGTIKNCSFREFNTAIYNVGRGLSCLNNLFVGCGSDIVVYLPKDLTWTTTPNEAMQHQMHPDLMGRALRVINNRHHITKTRLLKVVSEDYIYDGVNYITSLKGAMITGNVCDLGRGSYEFDCHVVDSIIANNIVNRCQMTNILSFHHEVINTNICGNNVKGDIHEMVTPYTPTNFIRGERFADCTIANNNITNIKGSCIYTLHTGVFERNSVIGNVMTNTGYDETITAYQRSAFILANANNNVITNNVFGVMLDKEGCCVRPIDNDGVWYDNIIINNVLPYGITAVFAPSRNSERNRIENNV